ncbi:hypothetical protein [Roseivirga sp. E12]|uniref:hypothetical protein n=1 Tax=Roseivirga sp. E12 TaxID=2819237 RepID=UPI001ABCED45|nr:hypothetical protein [Roseivirga sp. E12]MBO3699959.1 hypothetical protein [Roseivirga sp. E12]
MLKKVTVLVVTCFIGLCFTNVAAYAQEGGEEDPEEEVVVRSDSSNTEVLLEEGKPEPTTNDVFKIPSEDSPSASKPIVIEGIAPKTIPAPVNSEKKVKDGKSDVSFNIFYYLFYKFKQVDG